MKGIQSADNRYGETRSRRSICPPGVAEFKCYISPCPDKICLNNPSAICIENYCGGCKYDYYLNGRKWRYIVKELTTRKGGSIFESYRGVYRILEPIYIRYIRCEWDGTIRFFYGDDFPKLEKLTTKYPHLKILISVGGKYNGFMFSQLTTDALQTFASNCKTLIQQYGLHGIDIAWENPIESEKARYENVLKILRQTLGPNAVITAKAPTSVKDFDGFDEVAMNNYLDYVFTPLFGGPDTIKGCADEWIKRVLETIKLLPWNYINVAAWDRYWDDIPKVPYAVKGIQWLSYDNETSLEAKIEWMCQKNYQGVMINDIAMEKTQTLIQFVRNAINYYCGESTTVTNPASTTTEEWYTPTTTDNNPDCSTDTDTICNNGQLLAKYPPDCNKYVDCRAQERPIMSFPSDLQFDEVNQYCDYEYNVHCIPCETSHIR
ncbi:unnamed protein product [Gordionus sp. m RMFG-2023]